MRFYFCASASAHPALTSAVRPALAGSAAGLGGAFMIGGGAALSVIAGFILGPGTGALPLIILMLFTTLAAVVCALWVMRRAAVINDSA